MPEARIEEEGFGSVVYGAVFAWEGSGWLRLRPFSFGDFTGRHLGFRAPRLKSLWCASWASRLGFGVLTIGQ